MKAILKLFDENPFVAIIALGFICITIIEVASIIVMHKLVAVAFLKELFN